MGIEICSGGGGGGSIPAPTALTPTVVSYSAIDLAWVDEPTAQVYIIESSTDNVTFTYRGTVLQGVQAFSDITLDPSTPYYYHVHSIGDGTISSPATTDATTDAISIITANLGIHLMSDAGVTATTWEDQTANGNDFTVNTGTFPTTTAGFNGTAYPSLRFGKGNNSLVRASMSAMSNAFRTTSGIGAGSMFFVGSIYDTVATPIPDTIPIIQFRQTNTSRKIEVKYNRDAWGGQPTGFIIYRTGTGSTTPRVLATNTDITFSQPFVIGVKAAVTAVSAQGNATTAAGQPWTMSPGDCDATVSCCLGNNTTAANMGIELCEVLAYPTELSAPDFDQNMASLGAKYGITVT